MDVNVLPQAARTGLDDSVRFGHTRSGLNTERSPMPEKPAAPPEPWSRSFDWTVSFRMAGEREHGHRMSDMGSS